MLISVVFAMLSIVSVLAFAAGDVTDSGAVSMLRVANSTSNDVVLSQQVEKANDLAKNATSQPNFQSKVKSESAFSTEWLFVLALFWFVILSNRRSV